LSRALCFSQPQLRPRALHSFPTRRSSDLEGRDLRAGSLEHELCCEHVAGEAPHAETSVRSDGSEDRAIRRERHGGDAARYLRERSEEHTSELQSLRHLVCRLLLEKKK